MFLPSPIHLYIPQIVSEAHNTIKSLEAIERWVIFRTNQGTDSHLANVDTLKEIHPYQPVLTQGWVRSYPKTIPGGHVIFSLKDESGDIDCAAYEPELSAIREIGDRDARRRSTI